MDKDDVFPGRIYQVVGHFHADGSCNFGVTEFHWWCNEPVTREQYEKLKREYDLKKTIENLLK